MAAAVEVISATERDALRQAVAAVLADRCDEAAVRAVAQTESGYDPALWTVLARDIGIVGLLAPPGADGGGSGLAELAVVLEETGRALYPGPLLGTSAVVWALARYAPSSALLPRLAAGELLGAVAVGPAVGQPLQVRDDKLSGHIPLVLDAAGAGVLVVEADGLWLVDAGAEATGVHVDVVPTVDLTRRFADVTLDGAAASRLADVGEVDRLRSVAAVLVACEQVGGAAAALASAVGYAGIRSQFGHVIGSYQAIKHRCAEVLLAVDSARAAAVGAAAALDASADDAIVLASIAKAVASAAYVLAAESNLQIHGGIGFTWEHSAQLHLKRAKVDELLFGDARWHRERLATHLGLRRDTT